LSPEEAREGCPWGRGRRWRWRARRCARGFRPCRQWLCRSFTRPPPSPALVRRRRIGL